MIIHRDCLIGCLLLCSPLTSESWSIIDYELAIFLDWLGRKSLRRAVCKSSLFAIVIGMYRSSWLLYRCWNPNSGPWDCTVSTQYTELFLQSLRIIIISDCFALQVFTILVLLQKHEFLLLWYQKEYCIITFKHSIIRNMSDMLQLHFLSLRT